MPHLGKMSKDTMKDKDYTNLLVLYSGGVDSTYFIENEPSAKHLVHFQSPNPLQTRVAQINAISLNRFITILSPAPPSQNDGEINQIHALYDTQMALNAGVHALSHGLAGIVMCFNKN